MNPFDWRGPQFLAFYVLASAIGFIYLYLVSRGVFTSSPRRPTGEARRHLRDPYLLAYLRGGVTETLKTVAFSLNNRHLLKLTRASLTATHNKEALQTVRHPLELAMLSRCSTMASAARVLTDRDLEHAVQSYVRPLRDSGLATDDAELRRRFPSLVVVASVLIALSAIKLFLAFQRERTNVAFLIILTMLVPVVAYAIFKRRRTGAGDRALADQQTLFARLKDRVIRLAADGATDEAVLVAAAFGLAALPAIAYPFAARLKRQAQKSTSDSWSSNCSSSCGSSCGGGGCGGGCGGCGS